MATAIQEDEFAGGSGVHTPRSDGTSLRGALSDLALDARELRSKLEALHAKLDADAGVTDADYAATLAFADQLLMKAPVFGAVVLATSDFDTGWTKSTFATVDSDVDGVADRVNDANAAGFSNILRNFTPTKGAGFWKQAIVKIKRTASAQFGSLHLQRVGTNGSYIIFDSKTGGWVPTIPPISDDARVFIEPEGDFWKVTLQVLQRDTGDVRFSLFPCVRESFNGANIASLQQSWTVKEFELREEA